MKRWYLGARTRQNIFLYSKSGAYLATEKGEVIKTSKNGLTNSHLEKVKIKNEVYVKIETNLVPLKELIAMLFLSDYDKNYPVWFKDGDKTNCNVKNLYQPIGLKGGKND